MLQLFFALFLVSVASVTNADDQVVCFNLYYNGPIKEIIKVQPSKLAFATTTASEAAVNFATEFVKLKAIELASAQIENIPIAGAILGSLFNALVDTLGGGEDVVETVYNELKAEIDLLKEYVDQRIEVVSVDYIRKGFGTSKGGILGYANHCQKTYKGDADDMMTCLENLRAMLIQQYHFFLPENDEIASYEQTLPLFRMYGQLFLDTLLEQISVAERRGKAAQAASHAEAVKRRMTAFIDHAKKAVVKIVRDQTRVQIMPKDDNPKCASTNHLSMCTCTLAIGPNGFDVSKDGEPTDKTKNYCLGVGVNTYGICETTKTEYNRKYLKKHGTAIVTYWTKQLGDAVENWQKAMNEVGKIVEEHKRSLPLSERIQFERDVERTIADEDRMIKSHHTGSAV